MGKHLYTSMIAKGFCCGTWGVVHTGPQPAWGKGAIHPSDFSAATSPPQMGSAPIIAWQWGNCLSRLLLCHSHSLVKLCRSASVYSSRFILSSQHVCTYMLAVYCMCSTYCTIVQQQNYIFVKFTNQQGRSVGNGTRAPFSSLSFWRHRHNDTHTYENKQSNLEIVQ